MARRVRGLIVAVAVVAAIATAAGYAFRDLRFSYVSSELRVALETAQTLVAALVTHLLYGRFRRTHLLRDLLLAYGMGLFAVANLFFVTAPVVGPPAPGPEYETWTPLLNRLFAAVAIAWAAWIPDRRYHAPRAGTRLLGAHVLTVAVIVAGVTLLAGRLPDGVEASLLTSESTAPVIEGHPVLLGAQILLTGLYWLAAAGFARLAPQGGALTTAFAAGFVLAGFARLNFFLYPSVYTTVVQTGDVLRLSCYLALLVGAERELHGYWAGLAQAAVAEQRRRTARELHDGVIQDLSLIRSRTSSRPGGKLDGATLAQVAQAAERALAESRRAIQALSGKEGPAQDEGRPVTGWE